MWSSYRIGGNKRSQTWCRQKKEGWPKPPLHVLSILQSRSEVHAELEAEVTRLLVRQGSTVVATRIAVALRAQFAEVENALLVEHVEHVHTEAGIHRVGRQLEHGRQVGEDVPVRLKLRTTRGQLQGCRAGCINRSLARIGDHVATVVGVAVEACCTI